MAAGKFRTMEKTLHWRKITFFTETDIKEGEIFTEKNIWVKRPSPKKNCIPAKEYKNIIGRKSKNKIKKDSQLKWDDLC